MNYGFACRADYPRRLERSQRIRMREIEMNKHDSVSKRHACGGYGGEGERDVL